MSPEKLDELIAQVKSLADLTTALKDATEALKAPPAPGMDTFTAEERDVVLVKIDELKAAISALVPAVEEAPVTPA